MFAGDNRKSAKGTKINTIQSEPKECSVQKSIERGGEIEHRVKMRYLDSSSDQPRNQLSSTDSLSILSKEQRCVVSQGSGASGQPNPRSGCEKGEVRGAVINTNRCSHCKRRGHVTERCWFLYPDLKAAKMKRGRRDDVEKRSENPNYEREGQKGSNEGDKCNNCKKTGHTRQNRWFLYPRLLSKNKKRRGGGEGAVEIKKRGNLRRGRRRPLRVQT